MSRPARRCCLWSTCAATLLAAAAADARVFDGGVTHAELQKLLIEAGLQAVTVEAAAPEPGSVPELVVMNGPARWYVQFEACNEGRCGDIRLSAGYNLDEEIPAAVLRELNEMMIGRISGSAYLDDERDPIVQADVNTDGVSGKNIQYAARAFDAVVRCASVRIGFDDTAGACDALPERLRALANQGLAADDISQVIVGVGVRELERILRENDFVPQRGEPDGALDTVLVERDGVRWTAAVAGKAEDQINGAILLSVGCTSCTADGARRANAYNSGRRWLAAQPHDGAVIATTAIPLAGGVTEASVGMMIRSFHAWAVNFEKDMPQ